MKIKLLKSCMLDGESKKVGFVGDVPTKTAKMLIAMGKAESLETETVELKMSVDVSPELDEKIKNIEAEFEKALAEKDELIKELKEDIKNSKILSQAEVTKLNEKIKDREAEYKTLFEDIGKMTFKDLKEKYEIN